MITWILVVLVHVGSMGSGNSNSVAAIGGFKSETECKVAGRQAASLVSGTVKELAFVCVAQSK